MQKTRWCVAAWAAALWIPLPLCAQDSAFRPPGVRDYVRQVLAGNAGYAAALSRVAASTERIAPAGALPDPEITFGVVAVPTPSFDFTAERMTRLPIGFKQRFPFPGKQAAASDRARADSAIVDASWVALEARLVAEAVGVYYELSFAENAVSVWRSRVTLADQAIAVAQTRYETGAAPQTDLLRARLRRAELVEEGWNLEAKVVRGRAVADALRGGHGDSLPVLTLVTVAGQPAIATGGELAPNDTLLAQLVDNSPEILASAATVTRAERNARVFAVAGRPDFTVALSTGIRFGGLEPLTTALVGVTVPVWTGRKQAPATRAAQHDVQAAQQEHDDLIARLTGVLKELIADLQALEERIAQTAGEIIPLAGAASVSALQRYQVGSPISIS